MVAVEKVGHVIFGKSFQSGILMDGDSVHHSLCCSRVELEFLIGYLVAQLAKENGLPLAFAAQTLAGIGRACGRVLDES